MTKKTIGIIRKIDENGRVSIPKEFRRIVPIKQVEIILVRDENGEFTIELKPVTMKR